MEVLKKQNKLAPVLKGLLMILICGINLLMIAYFVNKQIQIEKLGKHETRAGARKVASVMQTDGNVFVQRNGGLSEDQIGKGGALYSGDRIQTANNSRATLLIGDKMKLTLNPNALMVMPDLNQAMGDDDNGTVLELSQGTIHIDSDELGDDVIALRTPNAVINLKVRDIVYYHPASITGETDPGLDYLMFLKSQVLRNAPDDREIPEMAKANTLVEQVQALCGHAASQQCKETRFAAWRELNRLRKLDIQQDKILLTVSIDAQGKENIEVESGSVKVETASRTLTLAQGDTIELESEVLPTQASISENAQLDIVAEEPMVEIVSSTHAEPEDDFDFGIDNTYWR